MRTELREKQEDIKQIIADMKVDKADCETVETDMTNTAEEEHARFKGENEGNNYRSKIEGAVNQIARVVGVIASNISTLQTKLAEYVAQEEEVQARINSNTDLRDSYQRQAARELASDSE